MVNPQKDEGLLVINQQKDERLLVCIPQKDEGRWLLVTKINLKNFD